MELRTIELFGLIGILIILVSMSIICACCAHDDQNEIFLGPPADDVAIHAPRSLTYRVGHVGEIGELYIV